MSDQELVRKLMPLVRRQRPLRDRDLLNRAAKAIDPDGKVAIPAASRIRAIQTATLWVAGTVVVGTNVAQVIRIPAAGRLVNAYVTAKSAPFGAPMLATIARNGSGVRSCNLLAGSTAALYGSSVALAEGDLLTLNITQTGGSSAAANVTVTVGWIPT